MEYRDLSSEFGRWLGAHEGAPFMIFVEPVKGSGAFVTVVSDREQFEAAYKAYRSTWAAQSVEKYLEMEQPDTDMEQPEDE